jgi:hypothetical protein
MQKKKWCWCWERPRVPWGQGLLGLDSWSEEKAPNLWCQYLHLHSSPSPASVRGSCDGMSNKFIKGDLTKATEPDSESRFTWIIPSFLKLLVSVDYKSEFWLPRGHFVRKLGPIVSVGWRSPPFLTRLWICWVQSPCFLWLFILCTWHSPARHWKMSLTYQTHGLQGQFLAEQWWCKVWWVMLVLIRGSQVCPGVWGWRSSGNSCLDAYLMSCLSLGTHTMEQKTDNFSYSRLSPPWRHQMRMGACGISSLHYRTFGKYSPHLCSKWID